MDLLSEPAFRVAYIWFPTKQRFNHGVQVVGVRYQASKGPAHVSILACLRLSFFYHSLEHVPDLSTRLVLRNNSLDVWTLMPFARLFVRS